MKRLVQKLLATVGEGAELARIIHDLDSEGPSVTLMSEADVAFFDEVAKRHASNAKFVALCKQIKETETEIAKALGNAKP
jgi:hypothetical protein